MSYLSPEQIKDITQIHMEHWRQLRPLLEPVATSIPDSGGYSNMAELSIAISLKRIADSLQAKESPLVETCATCRFEDGGYCRFNAPVLASIDRKDGYGNPYIDWESCLPAVGSEEWCGQWRRKPL